MVITERNSTLKAFIGKAKKQINALKANSLDKGMYSKPMTINRHAKDYLLAHLEVCIKVALCLNSSLANKHFSSIVPLVSKYRNANMFEHSLVTFPLANYLDYERDVPFCNKEKYANSPMATLGDRVLSLMIAENLFDSGKTSEEITIDKAEKENNSRWFGYSEKMELYRFAFNDTYFYDDAPKNEQLPHSQHDRYFEALVAAIYKDTACFEKTRNIMTKIFKVLNQDG